MAKRQDFFRRSKEHSRTSPDLQFKDFPMTKQKTKPKTRGTMSELGEPFQKIPEKVKKKQKIKVKMPHVNKKREKGNCKNPLENPIQNIEKTAKIKVKLPHVNKKPQARKRTFQTPFSYSTLKLE